MSDLLQIMFKSKGVCLR